MNEEKLLDKTLCILEEQGSDNAYKFLLEHKNEIKEPTAQLYNFLYCLAAVGGHKEEALNFMEEAIIQKKMWYRSEVFDDEDLNSISDTERFKECRKVSDERYLEALKNTYTYFSWQNKTADKLAVALHGNQQNVEICRENWQFLNAEKYQIEYVQSKDLDSIDLFRWDEESKPQLPAVLNKIDNESYSEVLLCGFSAGCNEILKSILDKPDICNKIFLASPWIPVINSEGEKIAEKIAEHNIEVNIYCGKKDDDCYPLAVSFEKILKSKSVRVKTVYTEKEAHEFPENSQKVFQCMFK